MIAPAAYIVDDQRPGHLTARNLPPLVWVAYDPLSQSLAIEGPSAERFVIRFDPAFPGTRVVDDGAQLFVWTRRGVLRFDRLVFGAVPEQTRRRYPFLGEAKDDAALQSLVRTITG